MNKIVRSVQAGVIFITAVAMIGCGSRETSTSESAPGVPVKIIIVEAQQSAGLERIPGGVRPAVEATLEAKISGKVEKLSVREGSLVKRGDILITLSAHEMQARLEQALSAERQSVQDLERFKKLLPSGVVTQQEFDAVEARARLASAGVAEARSMVSYTSIEAPFDGVITKKLINEGDLATPGKPLLGVESQNLFRFESDVPESVAVNLAVSQQLDVRLSGSEHAASGTVSEISPTTDPNSRTRHVKVDLPADPLLRSGQFGYVLVPVRKRPSIKLPERALIERGQLEAVFVAQEGRALLRLVRTGKRDTGEVEILSGLAGGESVISEGVAELKDGQRIEIK
ncbi:MAG: efflux RND transporter periplasmic adaptor subunit [Oligoflexia bacterium]|nr:efflux RND transporter periplasmic adaptor subunit [Oligoflexia bacterium]